MNLYDAVNTVCLLKSLFCLETFNLRMNPHEKIKSEWMFEMSKQTIVGYLKNAGKYYGIIKETK